MSVNFYDKDNKELVRVAGGAMYATAHEAQITSVVNNGKVTYFRCGTMVNVYTNINIDGELAANTVLATGLPEPLIKDSSHIRACASVLNTNLSYDLRITANGELVVGQSSSLPAGDNYYVPACISYFAKGSNITSSASLESAVEDAITIKNLTPIITKQNVSANSGAWLKQSGKVVNVNFAALVTLSGDVAPGIVLYSGFPKPSLDIVRFGLFDATTVEVTTGLFQINTAGNLVADGQGLKGDTAYWGSFTYLTN